MPQGLCRLPELVAAYWTAVAVGSYLVRLAAVECLQTVECHLHPVHLRVLQSHQGATDQVQRKGHSIDLMDCQMYHCGERGWALQRLLLPASMVREMGLAAHLLEAVVAVVESQGLLKVESWRLDRLGLLTALLV